MEYIKCSTYKEFTKLFDEKKSELLMMCKTPWATIPLFTIEPIAEDDWEIDKATIKDTKTNG